MTASRTARSIPARKAAVRRRTHRRAHRRPAATAQRRATKSA